MTTTTIRPDVLAKLRAMVPGAVQAAPVVKDDSQAVWARIHAQADRYGAQRAQEEADDYQREHGRKMHPATLRKTAERLSRFEVESLTFKWHMRGFPADFLA